MLLNAAFPPNNTLGTGGAQLGPYPFGKESGTTEEPLNLGQIRSAGVSLSSLWFMADGDAVASSALMGKPGVAMTPVHKASRCYGYFDGHAATERVNYGVNNGVYDQ